MSGGLPPENVSRLTGELSKFLKNQKLHTHDRIRKCETFMSDPLMQSKSVKDGLACLLGNAEEDYGTLLHLERVLNMRNSGDFLPFAAKSSLNPSLESLKMRDRGAERTVTDSTYREGESGGSVDGDGDICDFELDVFSGYESPSVSNTREESTDVSRTSPHTSDEERDEYEVPLAAAGQVAINRHCEPKMSMARSLPVSIPWPEKAERLSRPEIESDEEEDNVRKPDYIPQRIAEIAKSMYDRSKYGALPTRPSFTRHY